MANEYRPVQPATGRTLGRYQLLQRIGRGGMGEVWLAEDPRLRRQVAIKTLPVHTQDDNEYLQRFEREARAAAALNHPHILPVHDFGEQQLQNGQSTTYLVMPYVQGGSLAERITQLANTNQSMSQHEALQYLTQAADAIDYAHAQGVMHRDIKPANMLLRADNWLMLADFGIARMLSEQERLTQTGGGFGTPEYMAPEQARGQAVLASDNYSLAVIAYQLFTGRVPFKADTPYATSIQHIISQPPPPRQINPTLSLAVEQILLRGLAKDPVQRAPSARIFVDALRQAAASTPGGVTHFMPLLPPTGDIQGMPITPMSAANAHQLPAPATPRDESKPAGFSRRSLLIGGGVALLIAGTGATAWAIATHQGQQGPAQTPTPHTGRSTQVTTPDPTAPAFILLGHNKDINALAWSPAKASATTLASSGLDGDVKVWNIPAQTGQHTTLKMKTTLSQSLGTTGQIDSEGALLLAWSPDGSILAIGNTDAGSTNFDFNHSYIALYKGDLSGNAPGISGQVQIAGGNIIEALAWSPGRYLVTGLDLSGINGSSNTNSALTSQYSLLDPLQNAKILNTVTLPYYFNNGLVANAGLMFASPAGDGTLALAATTGEDVIAIAKVVAGQKPTLQQVTTVKFLSVGGIAWSLDGNFLAAFSSDHSANTNPIMILNKQKGYQSEQSPALPSGMNNDLTALSWSPTTTHYLAAGDNNGTVYIWSFYPTAATGNGPGTGNGLLRETLPGPSKAKVTTLAWSNDGRWLAAGYNDQNDSIYVWDSTRWQG